MPLNMILVLSNLNFLIHDKKVDFKKTLEKYAILEDKYENINHRIDILDNRQYKILKPCLY
ncbi:MAG: hypothetical protein LBB45_04605 [Methanobrevibacter sp.]|jgi:hypothetical protein|nr:hypothetical protein [Candidatus Methanovirga basalitermitum]